MDNMVSIKKKIDEPQTPPIELLVDGTTPKIGS